MTTGAQEKILGYLYDFGGAMVNVKHLDYGAKGDGSTDDTTAIQSAINTVSNFATPGGGIVFLPPGTYIVTQLLITSKVTLRGAGWNTILKQKANTTDKAIIEAFDSTQEHYIIENLKLDGNKSNQATANDGINLIGPGLTSNDAQALIRRVWIQSCKGSGIVIGLSLRELRCENVWIRQCDRYGVETDTSGGTDNWFTNCTVEACGLSGFNLNGYNGLVSGCKAFGNGVAGSAGDRAGFRISAVGLTIENCWSQENPEQGFYFINAERITGSTLIADSNGAENIKFAGTNTGIVLSSCVSIQTAALAYTPTWGLKFDGNQTDCYVEIITKGTFSTDQIDYSNIGDSTLIQTGVASYGIRDFRGIDAAGDDTHWTWGKVGSGSNNNAIFAVKTRLNTGAVESLLDGYDGSTNHTFLIFDFENGLVYLGAGNDCIPVLPHYTDGQRPAAGTVPAGCIIFNTTANKPQVSDGAAWQNLY